MDIQPIFGYGQRFPALLRLVVRQGSESGRTVGIAFVMKKHVRSIPCDCYYPVHNIDVFFYICGIHNFPNFDGICLLPELRLRHHPGLIYGLPCCRWGPETA